MKHPMIDPSNYNALKRDAAQLAARLGWTIGQKRVYRPHLPPRTFRTWLALWEWLRRINDDLDAARARRAAEASRTAPRAKPPPLPLGTILRWIPG